MISTDSVASAAANIQDARATIPGSITFGPEFEKAWRAGDGPFNLICPEPRAFNSNLQNLLDLPHSTDDSTPAGMARIKNAEGDVIATIINGPVEQRFLEMPRTDD